MTLSAELRKTTVAKLRKNPDLSKEEKEYLSQRHDVDIDEDFVNEFLEGKYREEFVKVIEEIVEEQEQ